VIENKNVLLKDKVILLAEDDEMLARMYRQEISLMGGSVILACDGDDALGKIAENRIDIMVLDIMMPKMNGYELLRRAKDNPKTKNVPIIVLTNLDTHPEYIEKATGVKVEEYLIKADTSLDELVKKIAYHLKIVRSS
jgi:DNA-binding response OmpR family regulator